MSRAYAFIFPLLLLLGACTTQGDAAGTSAPDGNAPDFCLAAGNGYAGYFEEIFEADGMRNVRPCEECGARVAISIVRLVSDDGLVRVRLLFVRKKDGTVLLDRSSTGSREKDESTDETARRLVSRKADKAVYITRIHKAIQKEFR